MPASRSRSGRRTGRSWSRTDATRTFAWSSATKLLELAAAPLRFGLPDAFTRDGRALIRDLFTRRIRVRGLIRYLGTVRRLTTLLSVR